MMMEILGMPKEETKEEKALGNHGLWLAQIVYLAMRGILQTIWYRLKLHSVSDIGECQ